MVTQNLKEQYATTRKLTAKEYAKQEEDLETRMMNLRLNHLGYTIISTKHDNRYYQFTIQRKRK